jgi:hypothetical protein
MGMACQCLDTSPPANICTPKPMTPHVCNRRFTAQWLTWLAYVHVAFQPLMANLFFLYGQVCVCRVC